MEPAFFKGDILFLTNFQNEGYRVGDVVLFKIEGKPIPIVHRVIKYHKRYCVFFVMFTFGTDQMVHLIF